MSQQTAFDLVATKLLNQGQPSIGKGACVYLNPKGHRCAAGHLMTTRELAVLRKGGLLEEQFYALPEEIRQRVLDRHGIEIEFVKELQRAHDTAGDSDKRDKRVWLKSWIMWMRTTAAEHKLSAAVLGRRGLA